MIFFPIVFLFVLGFWLYAEKRNLNFSLRLVSGLACMAFIGLAIGTADHIGASYERHFHKIDMKQMEQSLADGDTNVVLEALHTYNSIAATDSTYRAAQEMQRVLPPLRQPAETEK